jgi:protein TonB
MAFLNRTLVYPEEAVRQRIQGTVVVQFIVDVQGRVSGIEAISGPVSGGLREETIRVIQKSGRWNPGSWNGYKVATYKRQPLTYKLSR